MTRPGRRDKRKDKEKKGGAAWAPGAGSAASSANLAPGVQAVSIAVRGTQAVSIAARGSKLLSPVTAVLQRMAESLGLGAIPSSQAGLIAMTLAVATAAAGVTVLIGLTGGGKAASPEGGYASRFAMPTHDSASALTGAELPKDEGVSSSLDMFARANPAAGESPGSEGGADALSQTAPPEESPAPQSAEEPAAPPPSGPKPALVAARPMGGASSMQGGGLKQMAGLNTGIGQNFQDVSKGAAVGKLSVLKTKTRANYRTNRAAVGAGSRKALSQLRSAQALSRKASAMSSSNAQSATASTPFDGANPGAGAGASVAGVGGAGQDGVGMTPGAGPAVSQNNSQLAEPPSPGKTSKNQTPYQNMIIAGAAALGIGMLLLMAAGMVIGQAQKAPDAATKASLYSMGKMLAMGAMACGGLAIGLGAMIAGQYGQKQQGIMFIAGGGVLAAAAVMVLVTAEKESQNCQKGLNNVQANVGGAINQSNTAQGMAAGAGK